MAPHSWLRVAVCLAVFRCVAPAAAAAERQRWSIGLEAAPEDRELWRRLAEIYSRRTAEEDTGEEAPTSHADPVLLRQQLAALPQSGATIVDADSIPPNYFEVSEAAAAALAAAAAASTTTSPPDYFSGEPPDKNLGIGSEVPAGVDPAEAMAACQPPWCYPAKCTSTNPNCPPIVCPPGTEAKLRPDGSGLYHCVAAARPCVPACRNGGVCSQSRCLCPVGFTGDYCETVNRRQCRMLTGRLCDYGCRRVGNDYHCLCPPWIPVPPGGIGSAANETCVPADPDGAPDEPCRFPCLNGVCRGGACVCRPGWRGDDCGRDVDECTDEWLNRCMYRCSNTIGSFRCLCPSGYQLSRLDGISCEPLTCPADCGPPGGRCLDGRCACLPGWAGDSCREDVDECATPIDPDGRPRCGSALCANTRGSFRCFCPAGQRVAQDGRSCASTDSCHPACRPDTGACVNGSCACRSGWSGPDCASDTDECALGFHACRHGCANTPGSYRCLCPPGHLQAPDGRSCVPDDPRRCSEQLRPCQNGGTCEPWQQRCRCQPGFYGDFCQKAVRQTTSPTTKPSTTPLPGEECSPACANGRCIRGSCVCDSGFEGAACEIRFRCSDSADCSHGWCGSDGRCVCLLGWRGHRCDMDANECDQSPAPCEHNCYNLPGSYRCGCDPGFSPGSNGTCVWTGDPSCPRGCRNGGRCFFGRCRCPPGYRGAACSADVDECALGRQVHGCEFACYNTRGSWECRCPPGYTRLEDRRTCRLSPPDSRCQPPCLNGGVCSLAGGVGNCACQRGFTGPDCGSDVDECALYRPCQHRCVNTVGSYTCRCPPGQLLRFDGVRCISPEEAAGRPDLLYRGTGVKGPTVAP